MQYQKKRIESTYLQFGIHLKNDNNTTWTLVLTISAHASSSLLQLPFLNKSSYPLP